MLNCQLVLDKLSQQKGHLDIEDLSPNQKKVLYNVMMNHGASQGFAYDRFFKEGFSEWELCGIEQAKADFLLHHAVESKGCGLAPHTPFYDLIGQARLKLVFIDYMGTLGMGANAVITRFGALSESNFRDYERIGIRAIVQEFFQEVEKNKVT